MLTPGPVKIGNARDESPPHEGAASPKLSGARPPKSHRPQKGAGVWDASDCHSTASCSTAALPDVASRPGSSVGASFGTLSSIGKSSYTTSRSIDEEATLIDGQGLDGMRRRCGVSDWSIDVEITDAGLGIAFMLPWSCRSLVISQVNSGGAIALWNAAHDDERVEVGDHVVSATSSEGHVMRTATVGPTKLLKFIKSSGSQVRLGVRRIVSFQVKVSRCMDLGLNIMELRPEGHLLVMQLSREGLISNYNAMVSPDLRVRAGDVITSICGQTRNLLEVLRTEQELSIELARQTEIIAV
mmetsp:Transcript_40247/g.92538  ORF Transcript_40247/g.92538 Transcript_40247/m.92538 type:complete len:299 (-) Transcript_40247:107-1003(-)